MSILFNTNDMTQNTIKLENKNIYRKTNGGVNFYSTLINKDNNTISGTELFNYSNDSNNMEILKPQEKQIHRINNIMQNLVF